MKDEQLTATTDHGSVTTDTTIQTEIPEVHLPESLHAESPGIEDEVEQAISAETFQTKKPVGEMSDQEVEDYYNIHLAGRNMGQMDTYELTVISRHGRIVSTRRNDLEQQGEQAELLMIRQAIELQANRQAMAVYLRDCQTRSINDLRRSAPTAELEVDFRFGRRVLTLKMTDIFEAWNSKANSKTSEFERLVSLLLQLAAETANQRCKFINRTPNRDWSAQTSDITWTRIVPILRNEDHADG